MHQTDPPLRPSDPEKFRRQVYERAARLRRRRIATAVTGAVVGATVVAVLLVGSYLPLIRPSNGRIAIGTGPAVSTVTSGRPPATGTTKPSSSTIPTSTSSPPNTQASTTTPTGSAPPTTTPPTSIPTETTTPTTTVVTPTSVPTPPGPTVPAACGQPAAPATSALPPGLARSLVGTWAQCAGPSIFGTTTGGAVQILANGTWRQLVRTSNGWTPLQGEDDSGTWALLPSPTSVPATFVLVRFVAAPATSTSGSGVPPSGGQLPTPQAWTTRVMLTGQPHERARFSEGGIVANYSLVGPSVAGDPSTTV